jgi:uncharacterized repeat protein (TIGR01451 family)
MRRALMACVVGLVLALPGGALGASISLSNTPSPPQAVKPGAAMQFSSNMTWTGPGIRYTVRVLGPDGTDVAPVVSQNLSNPLQEAQFHSGQYVPQQGAVPGRYRVRVDLYTQAFGDVDPEATAIRGFNVAALLGNARMVKFEDLNGNGRRDQGEPGVANWRFSLTAPAEFGGGVTQHITGPDGSVTVPGIPVGNWGVVEETQAGWVPTTPTGGQVTVTDGATAEFAAGNVRPAPLSGTVWIDTNRNGRIDAGESGRSGVTVTLSGVDGRGQAVGGSTVTAADGTYIFPGLMPGTYTVTETVPGGLEPTTPTIISGRVIVSNTPNPDNDFGLVPPAPVTPQGAPSNPTATPRTPAATGPPDTAIDKRGPATARGGDLITYRITVRSTGRGPARNVVVTDPIPRRMTLVALPQGATLVNGVVRWRLGTMAPGARRVLTLRLRLDPTAPAGRYTNEATVTATGVRPKRDDTTLRVRAPQRPGRVGGVTG